LSIKVRFFAIILTSKTFRMGYIGSWSISNKHTKYWGIKNEHFQNLSPIGQYICLAYDWTICCLIWSHIGYCKCISQAIQYKSTGDISRILILFVQSSLVIMKADELIP